MCENGRCWFQDSNFFWGDKNGKWDGKCILFSVHIKYSLIKTSFGNLTEPILHSSALLSSENLSSFPYPVCSHYFPNTATDIKISSVRCFTLIPTCASPGTIHILSYNVLHLGKRKASKRWYTPKVSRQYFIASPLVYDRKQSCSSYLGALVYGTAIPPSHIRFPSTHASLPASNLHTQTHTQMYILICKVGEKVALTVQCTTNFEFITIMKLTKHKLIWANRFSDKPAKYIRFFLLKIFWKQHKYFLIYDWYFQHIIIKIPRVVIIRFLS